jgi:putative flippase GtrA
MTMVNAGELARIARFLTVGLLNTCVGLGVIYACKYVGQMDDVTANATGYAVALVNSFLWNRRWTFAHSGAAVPAAIRFAAVFLGAYAANLGTVLFLIRQWEINSYLSHAIGAVPYTVLFYLGSRFFAFAR